VTIARHLLAISSADWDKLVPNPRAWQQSFDKEGKSNVRANRLLGPLAVAANAGNSRLSSEFKIWQ
jgi:hypothetical protein